MDFSSVIGSLPVPPTFTARSSATYLVMAWSCADPIFVNAQHQHSLFQLAAQLRLSFKIIPFALLHVGHRFIDVLPAMDGFLLGQVRKHLHAKSAVEVIGDAFLPRAPHDLR